MAGADAESEDKSVVCMQNRKENAGIVRGGVPSAAIKGAQIIASVSQASMLGGLLLILHYDF